MFGIKNVVISFGCHFVQLSVEKRDNYVLKRSITSYELSVNQPTQTNTINQSSGSTLYNNIFLCKFSPCINSDYINPLNPELNPICYLLALLGAHHFLHVSRIRVKLLTFRRLMSYTYGAPILDVSRSHTTTQHSR